MKIKLKLPLIFIIAFTLMIGLTSCNLNDNSNKTPGQLIEEAYGNKEFKISFSSETLDKPLEDLTYSANKIPLLPTPQKVGYIFEGWFLDSDYTMPYTDDTLLLQMKDLTLYPKWSKETFRHNGTYDIEFKARILDETIRKGPTVDEFGGYRDFSKLIDHQESYIEKSDDDLLLKLQFDCLTTIPFQTAGKVFTVRINKEMGTNIYIKNKIDSLSSKIKTIFIKIDDWDLSKPLLLDIEWVNYEHKDLTESTRYGTKTSYTVEIDLTKIIGFSKAYVDHTVPLEKGYYLAKTYFRQENNTQSMAKNYNPVYSYIYSDGKENYQLIKQNTPYYGLVADKHPLYDPIVDNYYDTIMTFSSVMTCFDVDAGGREGEVFSDYYPSEYNGGTYRRTLTEFNADTGKYYNIIDLDKDLTKEYICLTAVSGFMERYDGMGYIRQLLSIDYNNLIKLAECDYVPLSGDYFEYMDDFNFYPGNYDDLDQKNLTKPAILKDGISIEMPNFFYSCFDANDPINKRTVHSSLVEVCPNRKTSVMKTSESRGEIGEFEVNSKVFGYDPTKDGKLFLDKMSVQCFEGKGYNSQLRNVREVKLGKSTTVNEEVNIQKVFNDLVNRNKNISDVQYSVYELTDDLIDYNKKVEVKNNKLVFKKDVAIIFSYEDSYGKEKTVCYLKNIKEPTLEIEDDYKWQMGPNGHYVKTKTNNVGDYVKYPKLKYTWGNKKEYLVADFYETLNNVSINPAKACYYADRKTQDKLYLPYGLSDSFQIPEKNVILMYEINNEFNEHQFVYFDYISDPKRSYLIKDDLGNVISEDDLKFDSEGNRKDIYVEITNEVFYDSFNPSWIKNYVHEEDGYIDDYNLVYYDVYTNSSNLTKKSPESNIEMAKKINDFIKNKDYAVITFTYRHDSDYLVVNYLYNMTFNGVENFKALDYDAYFTNTIYTIPRVKLVSTNRNVLANLSIRCDKMVDNRVFHDPFVSDFYLGYTDSQIELKFKSPGTYRLTLNYSLNNSDIYFDDYNSKNITFTQYITVDSNLCDIEITYITDPLHPFKNNELERTETYSLGTGIKLLNFTKDLFDTSSFAPDREADRLFLWSTTPNTSGKTYRPNESIKSSVYIDEYNTKHITLYAIWEIRFTVYCHVGEEVIKVKSYLDYDGRFYIIKFPGIREAIIPKDTVFVGWTGGFLGSSINTKDSAKIIYKDDYYKESYTDYFNIEAVFKKQFKVSFLIDPNIAELIQPIKVFEGDYIPNPNAKLHVRIIDPSYEFVGYCLKDDKDKKIVDLSKFIVTDNTVFEAVFRKR